MLTKPAPRIVCDEDVVPAQVPVDDPALVQNPLAHAQERMYAWMQKLPPQDDLQEQEGLVR
ncbi:hypothetical protein EUX98_g9344 [Antrodiella citrinella]|uniref:Uncharacterized protein n=1 Tax=Antrodiella citrinella TaxID=2447956 RepID=A0A4S4LWU6_9APHY|nr:hypothetical protein EUX98_g9344 [Antrodiella citrinella]